MHYKNILECTFYSVLEYEYIKKNVTSEYTFFPRALFAILLPIFSSC
jgi:hypothetical protein